MSTFLVTLGAALIVAGVTMISTPAGVLVAGAILLLAGIGLERGSDGDK